MKKITRKILCTASALVFGATAFVGCGGGSGDNSTGGGGGNSGDKTNKTVLSVGVYDGGLGYEWAEKVAESFSEYYKDYEFEPGTGKKGIYVEVNHKKEQYEPGVLVDNILAGLENCDVYYTSSAWSQWEKVSRDITDILTEKVYDSASGELSANGTESILDKLDDYYVYNYNFGTDDAPKYSYLPYEDFYKGFIYDHDLFKKNGWLHYSGRDGVPGTVDEFLKLCDEIRLAGYTPWTYSPSYTAMYTTLFNNGFVAQYEGEEAAKLNLTLDGEYTFGVGVLPAEVKAALDTNEYTDNADGSVTVKINEKNGWVLAYQPSKKELVEFVRKVTEEKNLSPRYADNDYTFTETQKDFVMSIRPAGGSKTVAMIFEGEWWENEARDYFDSLDQYFPGEDLGYGKRDFRFMPIFKSTSKNAKNESKYSMYIEGATAEFVNKNTKQYEAVKKWIQFTLSESSLRTHARYTSCILPYDFECTAADQAGWSKFAVNNYNMKRDPEVTTYRFLRTDRDVSDFSKKSSLPMCGYGLSIWSGWSGKVSNDLFFNMTMMQTLTAERWYEGMTSIYTKDKWMEAYNKYYSGN